MRRIIWLVLAVLALSSEGLLTAVPQAIAATGGYPYANAVNCSTKYGPDSWCINGGDISPYGYVYRNCTDYVAWKILQVLGVTLPKTLGNASTWGARLKADHYSFDSSPRVGDIAAWNNVDHGLGHVAYVYAVSNGIASLDEYNVANTGKFSSNRTTASGSAGTPSEYVHIGNLPASGKGSDFNGDGLDDIAWHQGSTLYMLQATGNGTFSIAGSSSGIGTANWAGVGVDDTTGTPEVYWYQSNANTIFVLRWAGNGWAIVGSTPGIGTPDAAVVGDFNGDGLDDIAWHQGSTLYMLQATGNGTFSIAGSSGSVGTPDWSGGGVDNSGGQAEVYWHQGSTIYVLRWGGSAWGIAGSTPGIGTPDAAVDGDFNGDGLDDIAWHQGSTLYMLQATGNGTFSIAGSSGSVGTPDWSGGGVDNSGGQAEVYWHQGSTIYVLRWGGSAWGIAGSTPGIGTPDAAASSNPAGTG